MRVIFTQFYSIFNIFSMKLLTLAKIFKNLW